MSINQLRAGGDIARKMLALAIDVSEDETTPEYVVIGYKISDSTLEFNPDVESGTDINGRNYSSVNKFEPSQTFDPHRLTGGELGKLGAKLLHYFRFNELEKLSQFKCVLIYGMLESEDGYVADMYDACTLTPQSLGGESWTDMPFDVNFGGDITRGTVDKLIDTVDFTEIPAG